MDLGFGEIVVILVIVLLLFGPSKLPKLGEGLGSAMANFRKAMRGEDETAPKPAAPEQAKALPDAERRVPAPAAGAPAAGEAAPQDASRGGPPPTARA